MDIKLSHGIVYSLMIVAVCTFVPCRCMAEDSDTAKLIADAEEYRKTLDPFFKGTLYLIFKA